MTPEPTAADQVIEYLRCVPCHPFCSPDAQLHTQHCIQSVIQEPGFLHTLHDALATVRAEEQKRWSNVITYDRSKYEARVTELEGDLRYMTDWRNKHMDEHPYERNVEALQARVATLEAALQTAKTLWFNALFDQGTPRELHVTWYNEWLKALTPGAGGPA